MININKFILILFISFIPIFTISGTNYEVYVDPAGATDNPPDFRDFNDSNLWSPNPPSTTNWVNDIVNIELETDIHQELNTSFTNSSLIMTTVDDSTSGTTNLGGRTFLSSGDLTFSGSELFVPSVFSRGGHWHSAFSNTGSSFSAADGSIIHLEGDFTNENSGIVTLSDDSVMNINADIRNVASSVWNNSGTMNFVNGSFDQSGGNFTNQNSGTINLGGGMDATALNAGNGSKIINKGIINVYSNGSLGAILNSGSGSTSGSRIENSGTINNKEQGTVTISQNFINQTSGVVINSGIWKQESGSTFQNSGIFDNNNGIFESSISFNFDFIDNGQGTYRQNAGLLVLGPNPVNLGVVEILNDARAIVLVGRTATNQGLWVLGADSTFSNLGTFNNEGTFESHHDFVFNDITNKTGSIYRQMEGVLTADEAINSGRVEIKNGASAIVSSGETLINNGSWIQESGSVLDKNGIFDNRGVFENHNSLIYNDIINNTGSTYRQMEGVLTADGATNLGRVEIKNGASAGNYSSEATFVNNGTWIQEEGSTYLNRGTFQNNGIFENSGIFDNRTDFRLEDISNLAPGTYRQLEGVLTVGNALNLGIVELVKASSAIIETGATLTNNGTWILGEISNFTNNGIFENNGTFDNSIDIQFDGINNNGSGIYRQKKGALTIGETTNAGTIEIEGGASATIETGATLTNNGAWIQEALSSFTNNGAFENNGTFDNSIDTQFDGITNNGSGIYRQKKGALTIGETTNAGTIEIEGGASATIEAGATVTNNGTWTQEALSTFTNNGVFENNATFDSSTNLNFEDLNNNSYGQYRQYDGALTVGSDTANNGTVEIIGNYASANISNEVTLTNNGNWSQKTGSTFTNNNGIFENKGKFLSWIDINLDEIENKSLGEYDQYDGVLTASANTENFGTVTIKKDAAAIIAAGAAVTNNGTWSQESASTFTNNNGTFENNGLFLSQVDLNFEDISNSASGTYRQYIGDLTVGSDAENFGKVEIATPYASMTISNGATLTNNGNVEIFNNANLFVEGSLNNYGTLINNGSVSTLSGINQQGIYKGSGVIDSLLNQGIVAPGNSPGIMEIAGTYTEQGTLQIELGGLIEGSEYDVLLVTGNVDLSFANDLLDLTLINGFTPSNGDTFDIIAYSGIVTGEYSNIPEGGIFTLAGIPFVIDYNAVYGGSIEYSSIAGGPTNAVRLTVTAPEPTTYFTLGTFLLVAFFLKKRGRQISPSLRKP